MWTTVLPAVQPVVDKHGFGNEWRHMCTTRLIDSAFAEKCEEWRSRCDEGFIGGVGLSSVFYVSMVANYAANATSSSASAAAFSAEALSSLAAESPTENRINVWELFDPVGTLERLVSVSEPSHWRES